MKGDTNTFSIECDYKGIKMRSKFEANIAALLDRLKIKWDYEPQTFLLSNGEIYKPDFYLPEHKQWIEVKGLVEPHQFDVLKTFVKDYLKPIILLSGKEVYYFHNDYGDVCEENALNLGKCSKCHSYFFCSYYANYNCTRCRAYEGDHDIVAYLLDRFDEVDFQKKSSIKNWLEDHALRV